MRKLLVILILIGVNNTPGQDLDSKPIFSKIYFGVLGGTNFSTLPTSGTAIQIEVKSNITSNIIAKISFGYSNLYDDTYFEVKSYRFVSFDDYEKYHTRLLKVDRIKYTMIPVSIGSEYTFLRSDISPFALLELGYNFSSSLWERNEYEGFSGTFDTVEEIPEEYRKKVPEMDDGSSPSLGIGAGLKYILTDRMDLNVRYIYRFNEDLINNNQILVGVTF